MSEINNETVVTGFGDMTDYDVPVTKVTDVSHLTTQRSKIVFLHGQGFNTTQISKMLTTKNGDQMRYQHVRNELINAGLHTKK